MGSTTMPRLFFALWPDPGVRTALSILQHPLRGRPIHQADLHLTLAFLGQQPDHLLPSLEQVLARLLKRELVLTFDRVGYFARNRVAWAGPHATPQGLLDLHDEIRQGLAAHGVPWRGEREYKPHVTLARDADAPLDMVFTPIVWRARQVALVESRPPLQNGESGSRYRVLASRGLDQEVRVLDPGQDAPMPQVR